MIITKIPHFRCSCNERRLAVKNLDDWWLARFDAPLPVICVEYEFMAISEVHARSYVHLIQISFLQKCEMLGCCGGVIIQKSPGAHAHFIDL